MSLHGIVLSPVNRPLSSVAGRVLKAWKQAQR